MALKRRKRVPDYVKNLMKRKFIGLNTKDAAVMKAIYYNPNMPPKEIAKKLGKQGVGGPKGEIIKVNTTVEVVRTTRNIMRAVGISIPRLRFDPSVGRPETRIVDRVILAHPTEGSIKIKERLARLGISRTEANILKRRSRLREKGFQLTDLCSLKLPKKVPKLSKRQQKLLEKAMPFVEKALSLDIQKYGFSRESLEELRADVMRQLPRWIVNFKEEKMESLGFLKGYIKFNVKTAALDFMRSEVKRNLGITYKEARKVVSLIFGVSKGKTIEEVAKERKIPLKEAKELWEAYQAHKKTLSFDILRI